MEELYTELKTKHSLPELELMDKEFDVYTIDEEMFLLRSIRKKIDDKIEHTIKVFDDLLHPDSGFASYREANVFNDNDRDEMLNIYRRLMFFHRLSTELSFEDSDELNASFINEFMKEWTGMKSTTLSFVKRMKESWQKDISKKEVVGYLG